ncbi:hypothetical protein DYB32_000770 [Aphanomyces invadans]|uniref:HSF-type DNA-binding domain-containing protein n=1 Tax=Aphanomyces invadans TaxID=157072 RepID=A0A3R6VHM5_9STRA|nr:hypothetical protein DYB32_000770 [Aphanomyces invadans]
MKIEMHRRSKKLDWGDKVTDLVCPSLYEILSKEDPTVIGWCDGGKSFGVYDFDAMEKRILPTYFRHSKFASFQRQLNYFGFRKLQKFNGTDQSNVYCQPLFNRDDPTAMLRIKRKTYRLKSQTGTVSPCDGFPYSPSHVNTTYEPHQAMDHTSYGYNCFEMDMTASLPDTTLQSSFVSLLYSDLPSVVDPSACDAWSFQPIPFLCAPQDSWTLPDEDLTLLSSLTMPATAV